MTRKTALLIGATGLIGNELLKILLKNDAYQKITVIVRNPLGMTDPKLEEIVTDFDELDEALINFHVDDVFSCLGTTIKKAKSQEVMYKIDVTYPLKIAQLTRKVGARQFLFVSSPYANAKSRTFYTRIKGELEDEVMKIDFNSITIFRPSLLLGKRQEFRLGEHTAGVLFTALSFLFVGPLKKFSGIQGKTVAKAMDKAAQMNQEGVTIYELDQIEELGS
ncbi:oxidoreductase [Bacillus suaedae]|uniref:Oxidoreductase n=1 Tax=Halalkalibacter suaedae TaxID=2822140 RepID=A0A940X0A0_9BACI|nr:oxidoreductase [Bacillus suaedae]MBP3952500.1 oxidoreductase [Bacillus suaedae]